MVKLRLEGVAQTDPDGPGGLAIDVDPTEAHLSRRREIEEREFDGVGSVTKIREEINVILEHIQEFINMEPDEIMRFCSGYSARLTELRIKIQRLEDFAPVLRSLRTREVDALIDELKNQYNIASRLESVRALDWEMQRGLT